MPPLAIVLLVLIVMVFGTGIIAMALEYMQKMEKIKADARQNVSQEIAQVIESLRTELAELRDTATKYDLSFDSALQRLESRVSHLEQGALAAAASDSSQVSIGR